MGEHQQPRERARALWDLLLILALVVVLLWLGAKADAFESVHRLLHRTYPGTEDEILVGLALVALGLAAFAFRRWGTERHEIAARAEAETRYRALVEQMPAVTYTWDPRKRAGTLPTPYVSPQVQAILGFTPEEWQEDPELWIRQIHPDDRDRVLAASSHADRTGEPFAIEYRHYKKDGTMVWIRDEAVVVERDARGRPSLAQGIVYDITQRRLAEESVRETEARYRALVEQVPAVTYTWDPSAAPGTASAPYVSPQIEHLLGYSAEEWRGNPALWHERVHADDRERVLQEWDLAIRTRAAFSSEYRIRAHDGRLVWLRDEAVPVSSEGSTPRLYQGVMYDITERKDAEEQLLEAQERFRTLVEQIPAVVYIEDPSDGRNVYISPQVASMFGFTPEEWMADPSLWERCLHPEDRDRVVAGNDEGSGDRWSVEYRTIHRDGHVVWIQNEAVLIRDHEGHPLFWQGVAFDITERKDAEARLRQADETYRTLVEQLPVVVYQDAVDEQSTALYISPQYERLFGFPPEARTKDPEFWIRHLHPGDRERVLAESRRTNATGDPFVVDYRFIANDGRIVWVRDEAVLLRDAEGKPLYWQGVLLDITERKLAEETLSRRDAVLEAVGFAAERFLRSHDPDEALPDVLERLGEAAGASRVYVFENEAMPDGSPAMTINREWLAPDVTSIDEPSNQQLPYRTSFGRWETALSAGGPIVGLVRDFPAGEREGLWAEGVRSLVVVPVFVGDEWWGFLGFDDCMSERVWPAAEVEALKAAADTLGAAIGRARAERRQAETELRYRTLVESIPAVTYIQEGQPGGLVTYVSPQITQQLGYSAEEWGGHDVWVKSIHPDDRERVLAADARSDASGEPFTLEYRLRRKDGAEVWVHDEAVLVRDEDGSPRYWQGVRFDITAQKGAEAQLREAEERYRTLVETISAVIYIDRVDEELTTIYVSPQIETLFGYTADAWISDVDLWRRNLHPEDVEGTLEAVRQQNTAGTPLDIEYRFRAGDGTWRWVRDQATVVRDASGEPRLCQGLMSDITALKETQDQLRETEARYRALVEHSPAILYIDPADEHAASIYVSPQIEEIVGVTQELYLSDGDVWLELIHPEDRDRVLEIYRASLAVGEGWRVEYRVIRPDTGAIVWIRDESTVLPGEDGTPSLIQGVMFDVTERKLAEEALQESERREREAVERLRALDEMKNTFLAAVSHELRSPLTSILGLSLTLEQTRLPEEDQADLLGRLASNARKLDRLLKDLLDIDRLNRGIVTPNSRPTDVGALVRRTVESLDLLGERPILVEAEPVTVEADPAKLERIVENLLANATRHTSPDTGIWVRVWAEPDGVVIAVEDDGPGVPPELQRAIFEPFRQGPTASPHSPGTGIGLSLVAMFADLHGGRAWVQEREGGGASFRVFLPSEPPTRSETPNGRAATLRISEAG